MLDEWMAVAGKNYGKGVIYHSMELNKKIAMDDGEEEKTGWSSFHQFSVRADLSLCGIPFWQIVFENALTHSISAGISNEYRK